jgi:hypothetical protein
MKKIFLILSISISFVTFGQVGKDGNRICDSKFSEYGIEGKTFTEALDFAGLVHNGYQEYFFNEFSVLMPDFRDTILIKKIVSEKSTIYFAQRGLNFDESLYSMGLGKPASVDISMDASFSPAGSSLIRELTSVLKNYSPTNAATVLSTLSSLRETALQLESEKEVFQVGIPITIAISSYQYWETNGQKWMDTFADNVTLSTGKGPSANDFMYLPKSKCKVNLWHIGGADAVGAYGGALGGAALGPGGAFAGGVLASSVSSLGNLTNQVINCFVSWWPF